MFDFSIALIEWHAPAYVHTQRIHVLVCAQTLIFMKIIVSHCMNRKINVQIPDCFVGLATISYAAVSKDESEIVDVWRP